MLTPDSSERLRPNSPPDRIYLQWNGDGEPPFHGEPLESEVSWCREKVFAHDVEYIRASMAVPQPIETPDLEDVDDGACWTCGGTGSKRIDINATEDCPTCLGTGRESALTSSGSVEPKR